MGTALVAKSLTDALKRPHEEVPWAASFLQTIFWGPLRCDLIIPRINASKEGWATDVLPSILFCQSPYDPFCRLSTDRCRLATAHFRDWSSNQELTTASRSSARYGACYIT
ncbi:hypothetical protein L798_10253 [Zootermopsis nevadensis]|uniref:Uncharacterized protein n=1 Tax=Zootermopsis nevadensis TaxID=136037 RepID=A0A067RJ54_ZOONE|nr:hypothetical protein L798_10253 [Zootermopsis nevadensis]